MENNRGKPFEPIAAEIGLNQLISEPIYLMGHSKPCIDFIFDYKVQLCNLRGGSRSGRKEES